MRRVLAYLGAAVIASNSSCAQPPATPGGKGFGPARRFLVSFERGCPTAAPPEGGPLLAECKSVKYPARYECIETSRSTPNAQVTVEADQASPNQEFMIEPKPGHPNDLWDPPPPGARNKWKFKLPKVQYAAGSTSLTYAFTIKSLDGSCERDPVIIINR